MVYHLPLQSGSVELHIYGLCMGYDSACRGCQRCRCLSNGTLTELPSGLIPLRGRRVLGG